MGDVKEIENKLEGINSSIKDAIRREGLAIRRGRKFVGKVVSLKTKKTAVILIDSTTYFPKYKRYAKTRRKIHVHVPEGVELKINDVIEARPTRKISKTKSSVVYKILRREAR